MEEDMMMPNVAPAPEMEGTPMGGNLSEQMAPAQAELSPAEMQEAQGALMQIIQIIQMLVNQGMSEEEIQQFLAQYGITEEELDQAAAILGVDIDALMAGEQRMSMAEGGPSKAETIPRDAMDAANAAIGFRLFQDDDGSSKIYSPEQLENVIKVFYDQYEFQLNKGNQAAAKVLSDQINKLEALKIQMQAPQEPMMMAAGGITEPLDANPRPDFPLGNIDGLKFEITRLLRMYQEALDNNNFVEAQRIANEIDKAQQDIVENQDKLPLSKQAAAIEGFNMPMPVAGLNMRFGGSATGK